MRAFLKSMLVFLMVAAFGAATVSVASALPCTEHGGHSLRESVHSGFVVSHCDPVMGHSARDVTHHDGTDGTCDQPCSLSPASAMLVGIVRPNVPLNFESAAFPFPQDEFLTGISVAPPTGPPKLAV
jgi:hypothetical protein